jgi:hypothetical protein
MSIKIQTAKHWKNKARTEKNLKMEVLNKNTREINKIIKSTNYSE